MCKDVGTNENPDGVEAVNGFFIEKRNAPNDGPTIFRVNPFCPLNLPDFELADELVLEYQ